MTYPLHDVFSKFQNTIAPSGLEGIKKSIENFRKFEKVDFVSVVAAQKKDMFVYEKNINLNFGDKSPSSVSISMSLLTSQVGLISKVDDKVTELLLKSKIKPFDLQFVLVFNVELIKGDVRTFVRKISLVKSDDQGIPEYVLVTFLDITNTSKSDVVKSDVRHENLSKSQQVKVNQFKKDVDFILKEKVLLTKREKEILKVISLGKTSEEIAKEFNISKATVDTHRQNMLRKYDVSNVLELLQKCILD